MKTIYRFDASKGHVRIKINKGSEFLCFTQQQGYLWVYFLVDDDSDGMETRFFHVYAEHEKVPGNSLNYVGSDVLNDISYHCFEAVK